MIVVVQEKQSIFDIALQEFGRLDDLVQICIDNNISISTALTTKQELIINNEGIGNEKVKDFYSLNNIKPNNNFVDVQKSVNFVFDGEGNDFIFDGEGNEFIFN